jgi:hypothetical protein
VVGRCQRRRHKGGVESHGLFGSLTTVVPGSPEGPAEAQWVQANVDVVQLDKQRLTTDTASGAQAATLRQDAQTLASDSNALAQTQGDFATDTADDSAG